MVYSKDSISQRSFCLLALTVFPSPFLECSLSLGLGDLDVPFRTLKGLSHLFHFLKLMTSYESLH